MKEDLEELAAEICLCKEQARKEYCSARTTVKTHRVLTVVLASAHNPNTAYGDCAKPHDSVWQFYLPEFLRALRRARAVENRAPADPTSASTTVGFSGESVHPV
jgi:hypothetical protein